VTRAKKYQTEQNFLCAIGPKHLRTAVQRRHPPGRTHVRFTPESGRVRRKPSCPLWAKSGHSCRQSSKLRPRVADEAAIDLCQWIPGPAHDYWPRVRHSGKTR